MHNLVETPEMSVLTLRGFKPFFHGGSNVFTGVAFLNDRHLSPHMKSVGIKTHKGLKGGLWMIHATRRNGSHITHYVNRVASVYRYVLPFTVYDTTQEFLKAL